MNYKESLEILDLSDNFTIGQLKKSYYKKAIRFHPDKNPNGEEKFKDINNAYQFLIGKCENMDNSYEAMIKRYIELNYPQLDKPFVNKIIETFIQKVESKTFDILKRANRKTVVELYRLLLLIDVHPDIRNKIEKIINEKECEIIVLNPTIDNLLNDELYKLSLDGEIFYIPLWKKEVKLDNSGQEIIVKCIPETKYVIDSANNIYMSLHEKIINILNKSNLDIIIGKKTIQIDSEKLKIVKKQTITVYNRGILKAQNKLFEGDERGNIYINLILC